ncbi:hypothetical protein BDW59DRAFT_146102 [Aspergillus cavernicola]|uniref:Uncharacterized protein n=1 Tax=Aspergillus cavernicola TaxID=176166 RepID=A0ABR4ID15_9EURO
MIAAASKEMACCLCGRLTPPMTYARSITRKPSYSLEKHYQVWRQTRAPQEPFPACREFRHTLSTATRPTQLVPWLRVRSSAV